MAAGDLVAHSDITRVRIPAGQVAIPVPITAGGHAWVRAGDDLLLYPMTTSSSMESGVDDTAFHGVEPIGPVKVLSTTSEEADAVSTGSQAPSILVLVDRDQAPRLAEAAASASFLAALMP